MIFIHRSFRKEATRCKLHDCAYYTDTRRSHSVRTHQQVFWFDVSVHYVETVEVFDGVCQIVEHSTGVPLRVSVGRGDGVKQISPLWTKNDGSLSV